MGSTYTSDGSSNDEGGGTRGDSTDQAADLKDEDGEKIYQLDIEELVDSSVHWLQRRGGEKIGGAIPALFIVRPFSSLIP